MADLCFRARRHGLRCVTDPAARCVHHLERSSPLRETLHVYYVLRNRFLYVRKHHPRQRVWLDGVWSCRAIYAAAAALVRGRPRRARAIALGLVHGLSGRFGGQNDRVLR
jgi:GT2 family glycosyltransferase